MTVDYRYRSTRRCDKCGDIKVCFYESTGPFRGTWRCRDCEDRDTDALADMAKAASEVEQIADKEPTA